MPVLSLSPDDTLCVLTVMLPHSLENSSQVGMSLDPMKSLMPQLPFTISATVSPYTFLSWAKDWTIISNQIFLERPTVIILSNLSIFGMLPNSSSMKKTFLGRERSSLADATLIRALYMQRMNTAASACLVSFSSGILRKSAVGFSAKVSGRISVAEVRAHSPSSLNMDSLSKAMLIYEERV